MGILIEHIFSIEFCPRQNLKRGNGICVVHCNNSVGRTGVFIGLMNLMAEIDEGKEEVDILETVFKMREERMQMVSQII